MKNAILLTLVGLFLPFIVAGFFFSLTLVFAATGFNAAIRLTEWVFE